MNTTHPTRILFAIVVVGLHTSQNAQAITIAAAKLEPLGSFVTIENVVISNTIDLVNSVNSANFHVQDGTDGVTIFGLNADISAALAGVTTGDSVEVSGVTTTFSGLFELQPPLFVALVLPGVGVPTPTDTSSADYQNLSPTAEVLESRLVSLSNVQFTGLVPGQLFTGLTNYTVFDGVNSVSVRLSTTTQSLVGDLIPTGIVNLKGIFSQFDTANFPPGVPGVGYQLLLLDDSSVSAVPEPSSIALLVMSLTGLVARSRARRAG